MFENSNINLKEHHKKFILIWADVFSNWGLNRTQGMIHGLLLSTNGGLCTDTIMSMLCISRGNANTNLRCLLDMGIIKKGCSEGCRKDYYTSIKDSIVICKAFLEYKLKNQLITLTDLCKEIDIPDSVEDNDLSFYQTVRGFEIISTKTHDFLCNFIEVDNARLHNEIYNLQF